MSGPLSQDEIEQLLDAIAAGDEEAEALKPKTPLSSSARKIKPFDFKRPDKFLKSRLRSGNSNFSYSLNMILQHRFTLLDVTNFLLKNFSGPYHLHLHSAPLTGWVVPELFK